MNIDDYEIRYCGLDEADKLQDFIHKYWKENHILSTNRELLDYQHKDLDNNRYNFVVAYNKLTDSFDVILGFIPYSKYDSKIENRNIWLAIWMKNDQEHPRGLGVMVLDFLEKDYKPTTIGSIGINDNIEQLYLKRGWVSGVLNMWYFVKLSKLISFIEKPKICYYKNKFFKSDEYYINRFEKHPFYEYGLYQGVYYRKISTEKGVCLRIVDFKKEFFLDEYSLNNLLNIENADYIDCLNFGLSDQVFKTMGFHKRSKNMIIPQWFEPLDFGVQDIKFAFKSHDDYAIFKGDSDQDRPNII